MMQADTTQLDLDDPCVGCQGENGMGDCGDCVFAEGSDCDGVSESEAIGSCEHCGIDVYGDSGDSELLCNQCAWMMEATT